MEDDHDKDTQDELHHEALQKRTEVAAYLRAIADGLESGRLRLSSGSNELVLSPPELCSFELRAREERNRVKLRLRLAWRKSEDREQAQVLKIQS